MKFIDNIHQILTDIEVQIVGNNFKTAYRNAILNRKRAEVIFKNFLKYHNSKKKVRVINISGINAGQFDVALKLFFNKSDIVITEWQAIDSLKNNFLKNNTLKKILKDHNIDLFYHDFTKPINFKKFGKFDIVLNTDIIEHLDYSKCLELLKNSKQLLNKNSLVFLTCPNPHFILDRLYFLLNVKRPWFSETAPQKNLKNNFYDHINIYPHYRLHFLLTELGYKIIESSSFNHFRFHFSDDLLKYLYLGLFNFLCSFIKFSKFTLLKIYKISND